jgi:hypothetical protein
MDFATLNAFKADLNVGIDKLILWANVSTIRESTPWYLNAYLYIGIACGLLLLGTLIRKRKISQHRRNPIPLEKADKN